MSSNKELIHEIVEINNWPDIEHPEHIEQLVKLAEEADSNNTTVGCLSAVLIRHQLIEEMTRVLIHDGQFLMKIALYNYAVDFKPIKGKMFGRLLDELNSGIHFPRKKVFQSYAREYNTIRIKFVHGLTKNASLANISKQAAQANLYYEQAKESYEHAHEWFRQEFNNEREEIIYSGAFPEYENLRAEKIKKNLERECKIRDQLFRNRDNK